MSRVALARAQSRGGGRPIFATETNTDSKGSRDNFVCIAADTLIHTIFFAPAAAACLRLIALSALDLLTSPRTGRTGRPRILRHIESGSENSALSSQRPHGPPMANPTPSIRVAPPDGAGNPIPERFPLGLAPRKPGPLAPARAAGPPKPTRGRADLRVSIAGR